MRPRPRHLLGLGLVLLVTAGPLTAAPLSYLRAGQLLGYCQVVDNRTPERALCEAYLAGNIDAVTTLELWHRGRAGICIPPEASPFQLRNTFLRWMDRNHVDPQIGAASAVINAFREAYPCR